MTAVDSQNSALDPGASRDTPEMRSSAALAGDATAQKPHLTLEARSGWTALNLLEVWQYRDLLFTLAGRDVKLRYKQTALGVIWVVLQPLIAAGIFAFVFGRVAKLPSNGLPYFLFAYAGLLGWNAFNSTLTKASACIVDNAQLVSKVYFPRLILPLSTVLSTLIDFAVAMVLMIVLLFVYRVAPGWGLLLLPIWLMLLIALSVGVGLFAAALMVPYRDLRYVIPVMMQFLLYASPVAYAASNVRDPKLRLVFFLNPITGLLEAFRWSLLGHGTLHWEWIGYSLAMTVLVFVFGAIAFKRMERKFADII